MAVPETEQVAGSIFRCASIVDSHSSHIGITIERMAVRINHREISEEEPAFSGTRLIGGTRTIPSTRLRPKNPIIAFLFPTFARITDQYRVICRCGIILRASDQLDVEIVREIRDDHRDRVGFLKAKSARQIVGTISQSF